MTRLCYRSVRAYARVLSAVVLAVLLDGACSPAARRVPSGAAAACGADTVGDWLRQKVEHSTRAAGLPALSDTLQPFTGREIRLWYGSSFVPITYLVRVRSFGDSVAGEVLLSWPVLEDGTVPGVGRMTLPGPCARVREQRPGYAICAAGLDGVVSWPSAPRRLEDADVWSLPDQAAVPRTLRVWDGHGVTIETRRGRCYRAYAYTNPEGEPAREYRQASAITLTVMELLAAWRAKGS